MKKVFLTFMIGTFCAIGFANEANNETKKETMNKSVIVEKLDDDRLVRVRITVDCDGDGRTDYDYSGVMDSSHVGAMVDQLVGSC